MNTSRLAILPNGSFFFYQEPFSDLQFNVIFEKDGEIQVLTPQITAYDLVALASLIKNIKPGSQFVELGAWIGQSTCFIGTLAAMSGGRMVTIDNFEGNVGAANHDLGFDVKRLLIKNLQTYNLLNTVKIIDGDTCCARIPTDFIFIDANHTYSGIKRDIEHWWPLVNPGGIMCGHDFDGPEYDEEYIEKDCMLYRHHGVIKAVRKKFDGMFTHIPKSSIWWVQKNGNT